MQRKTEIITIHMETDGTNTTGDFQLQSNSFTNTPTYLQLDKGLKAKIWTKEISGGAATITISYTDDVTASPPTWTPIDVEQFPGGSIEYLEKRKPRIVIFKTGKEAIKFSWSQSTAAKTYVTVDIEVEPLE